MFGRGERRISAFIAAAIMRLEIDCPKQQKEMNTLRIQMQEKVLFRRALQIQAGEYEAINEMDGENAMRFDCKMSEEVKKKFSPWAIEKALELLGEKAKSEKIEDKVTTRYKSEKMSCLGALQECEVTENRDEL